MKKTLKENKTYLNEYIKVSNILTEVLNINNKKQYSEIIIKKFEEILKQENVDNIIEFIYNNKININSFIKVNYRQNQIIYLNNNKDINLAKQFKEYELLKKDIENIILKDKNFIIQYMRKCCKNKSRQKGNLLSKYFEYFNTNKTYKNICNNMKRYSSKNDYLKDEKTTDKMIFIPNNDIEITEVLNNLNINLKTKKGRDILIKYKNYFFIFEAKEIHEEGGSQNNNFKDLLSCLNETNKDKKIIGAGVLYGACNLYENTFQTNSENNNFIITLSELTFHLEEKLDLMIKAVESN